MKKTDKRKLGNHPVHPKCPFCKKALYKAFGVGSLVKKDDPWIYCRNSKCELHGNIEKKEEVEPITRYKFIEQSELRKKSQQSNIELDILSGKYDSLAIADRNNCSKNRVIKLREKLNKEGRLR